MTGTESATGTEVERVIVEGTILGPKTATLVRANLPNSTGTAHLYLLNPPIEGSTYNHDAGEYRSTPYSYVRVSATVAYSGPETYIFGADENGKVVDWGELEGSYRGGLDHEAALNSAGYEVVSAVAS